jgi:hypothetical protein
MGALEILLSSGADAHASDLLGRTPLQVCLDGTSTIAPETWGGSVAVRNRPAAAVSNSSYPPLSLGSREAVSALLSSAMKQSSTGDDASADAPLRRGGEGGMEGREGGDRGGQRGTTLEIAATLEKGQLHAVLTDEEKSQLSRAGGGSRSGAGGGLREARVEIGQLDDVLTDEEKTQVAAMLPLYQRTCLICA